ncbi:uncharacterized protein LOC129890472 [Solanum dulcamara]|uniref:uncharacterized protein LOC129890472 n=1 Tax=Solanum dulcamara TaxID=45834 RepID=UPI002486C6AB|nr:uncharacterized protein LOC129890472 [Solanum dulcamara]
MKGKQDQDLILLQLKDDIHKQKVMAFAKRGDGVLRYQERLCIPSVDGIRERIMIDDQAEHTIQNLQDMLRACVIDFKALYKALYGRSRLLISWLKVVEAELIGTDLVPQAMEKRMPILEWKWENSTINFVTGLSLTFHKHDSVRVIVDRLTKSAHFISMKTSYNAEQLARIYIREIEQMGTKLELSTTFILRPMSRQKSYADRRVRDILFAIDKRVLLKVLPTRGVMRFERKRKLNPRFIGPFEVLDKYGKWDSFALDQEICHLRMSLLLSWIGRLDS